MGRYQFGGQDAALAIERIHLHTPQRRNSRCLVVEYVTLAIDYCFFPRTRQARNRDQVGHRSGRHKQGCFFSEEISHALFQ